MRAVMQMVYQHSTKAEKLPADLATYLEYFNDKGVTKFPLSDPNFGSLMENINGINEGDLNGGWASAIKENHLDLRNEANHIIEFSY